MAFSAVFDTVILLQAVANPAGPAGGCLRLVTENKVALNDLLDLMDEGNADGLALKALHPAIEITDPLSFLSKAGGCGGVE